MKIKKIKVIESESPILLIDIGIENDQTFYVSDKIDGKFFLTHNSLPDIDCLIPSTLVKTPKGKIPISELIPGDFIIDPSGFLRKVLYTKTRKLNYNEPLFQIYFNSKNDFIIATENHRLPNEFGVDIKIKDLKKDTQLLNTDSSKGCIISDILRFNPSTCEEVSVVDITVEGSYFVIYSSVGTEIVSHNSDCADREEAIKILIEHFGEESVLPVSNYNQLQLKSLIKDLARLYQIPFEVINPITQKIEKETLDEDKKQDGFDRGVWFLSYESAVKNSPTFNQLLEDYPQLEASIKVLFKQIKSCFTNDTVLLTDKGWKKYSEITEQDKIAFVDNVGDIQYSSDFFKVENGEKEVYKIETADGKVIELTEDHLVQTDKGWKQVKDLSEEDSLIGWM